MPASANRDSIRSCSGSPPANPTRVTHAPSPARFIATLAGAARLFVLPGSSHHGHRRLGRDALDLAPDVLIEHHIANHQNWSIAPAGLDERDNFPPIRNHSAPPGVATATAWLMQVASSNHSHKMWPKRMWPSWMRAVSLEAMRKHTSARPAILPPVCPVMATVNAPR